MRVRVDALGPGGGVNLLVYNHRAIAHYAFHLWLLAVRWLRIGMAALATAAGRLGSAAPGSPS